MTFHDRTSPPQLLRLDLGTLTWSTPELLHAPPSPPLRGRLGAAACVLPDGATVRAAR